MTYTAMNFDSEDQGSLPYSGLITKQVHENGLKHGVNVMTPPLRTPWWKLLLENLKIRLFGF